MRPQPSRWAPITRIAKRLVEIDWRTGIPAGQTLTAATAKFTSKPAGLQFDSVTISGTKTSALMSHPGALNGDVDYTVHATVSVSDGQVLDLEPGIDIIVREGVTYP